MAPSGNDKEKKSRWRSMLGGGRDAKEDDVSHVRPGSSPKDSAYGSEGLSSEQPSARSRSSEPSETKVKQDPSTGNILTTTVTTTTTTTTVTTNKGEHIKTESTPTAEADATARIRDSDEPADTSTPANTRPASEQNTHGSNASPSQTSTGQPRTQHDRRLDAYHQDVQVTNPAELDAPVPGAASAEDGPPIPVKSNRRISRDMGTQPRPISEVTEPPVSPIASPSQQNFSYPARTPPHQVKQSQQGQQPSQPYQGQQPSQGQQIHQGQQSNGPQHPPQGQQTYQHQPSNLGPNTTVGGMERQSQRPGTFQNLKTAAAGIHGAGETLRGTFNSSIDRHVGNAPASQVAAHDRVAAAGASEIESGRFHDSVRERERLPGKGRFGGVLRKPVGNDGQG